MTEQMVEALAAYSHLTWAGWMEHLFTKGTFTADGSFIIDATSVERWQRQMHTAYADLTDAEKQSDRDQVDLLIVAINAVGAQNG